MIGRVKMKKKVLSMIICIVAICNVSFAGPLFMTKARFATIDLDKSTKYGTIRDLIGVDDPLNSPAISIFANEEDFVDFETGILTGINDTDNPNEKLLTFIFRVEDGINYRHFNYDYSNYDISDLSALISIVSAQGERWTQALDYRAPIMRYNGEIPEEEIERLLFVGTGKKYEQK